MNLPQTLQQHLTLALPRVLIMLLAAPMIIVALVLLTLAAVSMIKSLWYRMREYSRIRRPIRRLFKIRKYRQSIAKLNEEIAMYNAAIDKIKNTDF